MQKLLYLLGPESLYWYTLLAVDIPEYGITINLPCLCHNVYGNLLSHLTYMVCHKGTYMYRHSFVLIMHIYIYIHNMNCNWSKAKLKHY